MKKDNVIPVNQNFQNISDIFVLIYELIAAKIFGDKVSKKYDKTFRVLLIIPIISIFMLHNLFGYTQTAANAFLRRKGLSVNR